MIKKLLNHQTIQIIPQVENWREAVKISCQPLLDLNYIQASYLEAIYKSHEEIGPYYVLAPNIAMPHARPEDGVNQMALGLTIIHEGVNFGSDENDPVKLIFVLAAVDSNSHVQLMSQLAELFMNEEDVQKLSQCQNVDDILVILGKYE